MIREPSLDVEAASGNHGRMALHNYRLSDFRGYDNPFGAPVLVCAETFSTMNDARDLVERDGRAVAHGTVLRASYQLRGRGRFSNRVWVSPRGSGCLFTVLLQIERLPLGALPLRVGVAVAEAIDSLGGGSLGAELKWPNDVMLNGRKVAGVLCEARSGWVSVGIGINCAAGELSPRLRDRATSLSEALGRPVAPDEIFIAALKRLHARLAPNAEWREAAEARLYRHGEPVAFLSGLPEQNEIVRGRLIGLAPDGCLMLELPGYPTPQNFISGELLFEDDIDGHPKPGA
jgi:BirA family transcriptional regulator, biotin operon repressor / biotin---[acetyl-CoA-carboxylase] ligase